MTQQPNMPGKKRVATGQGGVAASQHHIVTDTIIEILRQGGNAFDAAIAGSLVQAVVQQDQTNHAGTVSLLGWRADQGRFVALNSIGQPAPGLAPFRPVPPSVGGYARDGVPYAVIPGYMPGMSAIYEAHASLPWKTLCQPAVEWAHKGHIVEPYEAFVIARSADFYLHSASARRHFARSGYLPRVGERWHKPDLARTMERLSANGPAEFIEGDWARAFVARGNSMGWQISLDAINAFRPVWQEPLTWQYRGHEIVQMPPPDRQAVFTALTLRMFEEAGAAKLGHYAEDAEALYFFAHALRRATWETGYLYDPATFSVPVDTWMDPQYARMLGRVLRDSRPKADLSDHVRLLHGRPGSVLGGELSGPDGGNTGEPPPSCELSIVDASGNWVQMMTTLQGGGIPGEVVEGVPMVGSHGRNSLINHYSAWFAAGSRMRTSFSHTFIMEDGRPKMSFGTPGNVHCTVPQVLVNLLDHGMSPSEAVSRPRFYPMSSTTAYRVDPGEDAYVVAIEDRVAPSMGRDLAKLGVLGKALPYYDIHMGSFQIAWREDDGRLSATTDPRQGGAVGVVVESSAS